MTAETERILQKAQSHLERGQVMLGAELYDDAGRASYLAAFHAAEAVIFERTSSALAAGKRLCRRGTSVLTRTNQPDALA